MGITTLNILVECFNYEDENLIDYLPEGSVLIQTLNDKQADLYALCLFNSGSTNTLINQQSVPPDIPAKPGMSQPFTTTQGTYESSKIFLVQNSYFPDFCKSRKIPKIQIRLFNSPNSQYDVIISRDILKHRFVLAVLQVWLVDNNIKWLK